MSNLTKTDRRGQALPPTKAAQATAGTGSSAPPTVGPAPKGKDAVTVSGAGVPPASTSATAKRSRGAAAAKGKSPKGKKQAPAKGESLVAAKIREEEERKRAVKQQFGGKDDASPGSAHSSRPGTAVSATSDATTTAAGRPTTGMSSASSASYASKPVGQKAAALHAHSTALVDGSGETLPTRRIWSEPSTRVDVVQKNPELVFDFELDEGPIPYRFQGDEDMYTPEAIAARKKLKHDPRVIAAMDEFWQCYAKDAHGRVGWDEYRAVYLKMCKALNTGGSGGGGAAARAGFDVDEAEKLAKADFERDTKGYGSLNRAMCRNSLFELADLWTRTVSADDYVSFLHKLFYRITVVLVHVDGTEKPAWKGLELITALMSLRDDQKTTTNPNALLVDSDDDDEFEEVLNADGQIIRRRKKNARNISEGGGTEELKDDDGKSEAGGKAAPAEVKKVSLSDKEMMAYLQKQRANIIAEFAKEDAKERRDARRAQKREQRDREIQAQLERDARAAHAKQQAAEDRRAAKHKKRRGSGSGSASGSRAATARASKAEQEKLKAAKLAQKKLDDDERERRVREEARNKRLDELERQKRELEEATRKREADTLAGIVFPNPLAIAAAVEKKKRLEEAIRAEKEAQAADDRAREERAKQLAEEAEWKEVEERKKKFADEKKRRADEAAAMIAAGVAAPPKHPDDERPEMTDKEWREYLRKEKADMSRLMESEKQQKLYELEQMKSAMAKEWKEYEKWKRERSRDRNWNRKATWDELERAHKGRDTEWRKQMANELAAEAKAQWETQYLIDHAKFVSEEDRAAYRALAAKAEADARAAAEAAAARAKPPPGSVEAQEERWLKMWKLEDEAAELVHGGGGALVRKKGSGSGSDGDEPDSKSRASSAKSSRKSLTDNKRGSSSRGGSSKPGSKPGSSHGGRDGKLTIGDGTRVDGDGDHDDGRSPRSSHASRGGGGADLKSLHGSETEPNSANTSGDDVSSKPHSAKSSARSAAAAGGVSGPDAGDIRTDVDPADDGPDGGGGKEEAVGGGGRRPRSGKGIVPPPDDGGQAAVPDGDAADAGGDVKVDLKTRPFSSDKQHSAKGGPRMSGFPDPNAPPGSRGRSRTPTTTTVLGGSPTLASQGRKRSPIRHILNDPNAVREVRVVDSAMVDDDEDSDGVLPRVRAIGHVPGGYRHMLLATRDDSGLPVASSLLTPDELKTYSASKARMELARRRRELMRSISMHDLRRRRILETQQLEERKRARSMSPGFELRQRAAALMDAFDYTVHMTDTELQNYLLSLINFLVQRKTLSAQQRTEFEARLGGDRDALDAVHELLKLYQPGYNDHKRVYNAHYQRVREQKMARRAIRQQMVALKQQQQREMREALRNAYLEHLDNLHRQYMARANQRHMLSTESKLAHVAAGAAGQLLGPDGQPLPGSPKSGGGSRQQQRKRTAGGLGYDTNPEPEVVIDPRFEFGQGVGMYTGAVRFGGDAIKVNTGQSIAAILHSFAFGGSPANEVAAHYRYQQQRMMSGKPLLPPGMAARVPLARKVLNLFDEWDDENAPPLRTQSDIDRWNAERAKRKRNRRGMTNADADGALENAADAAAAGARSRSASPERPGGGDVLKGEQQQKQYNAVTVTQPFALDQRDTIRRNKWDLRKLAQWHHPVSLGVPAGDGGAPLVLPPVMNEQNITMPLVLHERRVAASPNDSKRRAVVTLSDSAPISHSISHDGHVSVELKFGLAPKPRTPKAVNNNSSSSPSNKPKSHFADLFPADGKLPPTAAIATLAVPASPRIMVTPPGALLPSLTAPAGMTVNEFVGGSAGPGQHSAAPSPQPSPAAGGGNVTAPLPSPSAAGGAASAAAALRRSASGATLPPAIATGGGGGGGGGASPSPRTTLNTSVVAPAFGTGGGVALLHASASTTTSVSLLQGTTGSKYLSHSNTSITSITPTHASALATAAAAPVGSGAAAMAAAAAPIQFQSTRKALRDVVLASPTHAGGQSSGAPPVDAPVPIAGGGGAGGGTPGTPGTTRSAAALAASLMRDTSSSNFSSPPRRFTALGASLAPATVTPSPIELKAEHIKRVTEHMHLLAPLTPSGGTASVHADGSAYHQGKRRASGSPPRLPVFPHMKSKHKPHGLPAKGTGTGTMGKSGAGQLPTQWHTVDRKMIGASNATGDARMTAQELQLAQLARLKLAADVAARSADAAAAQAAAAAALAAAQQQQQQAAASAAAASAGVQSPSASSSVLSQTVAAIVTAQHNKPPPQQDVTKTPDDGVGRGGGAGGAGAVEVVGGAGKQQHSQAAAAVAVAQAGQLSQPASYLPQYRALTTSASKLFGGVTLPGDMRQSQRVVDAAADGTGATSDHPNPNALPVRKSVGPRPKKSHGQPVVTALDPAIVPLFAPQSYSDPAEALLAPIQTKLLLSASTSANSLMSSAGMPSPLQQLGAARTAPLAHFGAFETVFAPKHNPPPLAQSPTAALLQGSDAAVRPGQPRSQSPPRLVSNPSARLAATQPAAAASQQAAAAAAAAVPSVTQQRIDRARARTEAANASTEAARAEKAAAAAAAAASGGGGGGRRGRSRSPEWSHGLRPPNDAAEIGARRAAAAAQAASEQKQQQQPYYRSVLSSAQHKLASAASAPLIAAAAKAAGVSLGGGGPKDDPTTAHADIYFRAGFQAHLPETPAPEDLEPEHDLAPSPFVTPVPHYLSGAAASAATAAAAAQPPVVLATPHVSNYSGHTPQAIIARLTKAAQAASAAAAGANLQAQQHQQQQQQQRAGGAAGGAGGSGTARSVTALALAEAGDETAAAIAEAAHGANTNRASTAAAGGGGGGGGGPLVTTIHTTAGGGPLSGRRHTPSTVPKSATPMEFLPRHAPHELEHFILNIPKRNQGHLFRQTRKDRRLRTSDPATDPLKKFTRKSPFATTSSGGSGAGAGSVSGESASGDADDASDT